MQHNFLNTAGIFTKILLDIDIDGFFSNIVWFFPQWLDFSTYFHVFVIAIFQNYVQIYLNFQIPNYTHMYSDVTSYANEAK